MQNYIKTILSAFKTWTQKKIKDSTADWNENDSSKSSYVKNRTHWEEEKIFTLVDNLTNQDENWPRCDFVPGQLYTVIWNGIEYKDQLCIRIGDYDVLGNPEDDFPFYIDDDGGNSLWIESEDDNWTLTITTANTLVHKIPQKYLDLPTNLATTDDVKSAKQEALDVAGAAQVTADVKSNWNENDESSVGYVLNRTHYVTYNKLNTNYYWEHQLLANDQLRLSKSMYISFKHFINDCSVKPVYGDYIYNLHSKIIDKNTVNCLYTSPDSNVSINIILDDIAEEVIVSAVGLASGLLEIAFSYPKFEEVVYKLDEKYLPNGVSTQAINSKMNTTNPVGTGSFSMNRKDGIEIGDYSMTSGYGSVANHFAENVSGQYNIYEHPKFWVDTLVDETYTTLTFFKGYNYYYSNEYSFDQSTGIYKLINATYVSKDDIQQLKNSYIILVNKRFEPNITEGSRLMFVSYTRNTSTNYYTATGNVFQSVPDTSKKGTYTHIVGNGTSDTERSNAYTLDWDGNAWYSGDVYVGSTSGTNRDEGSKKLATETYVDEAVDKIDLSAYMTRPYEWVETAQGDKIAEGETMVSSFITDLDAAKEVVSSINTSSKALSELFRQINMMFYPTSYNNVIYKNVVSNILAEFNVLKENQYITNSTAITTYHYCCNNREFNDTREWRTYKIAYAPNTNQINITDGSDMYKYITFNAVTGEIEANFIPVTDTVLTQAKKPADAAAVGTAIAEAKTYAEEKATEAARIMKDDILNGAGEAYDTLKELGALIEENKEAIEALEIIAGKQADWNQSDANAKDFIKNKPTNLATKEELNKAIEEIDLSGYATETFVEEKIAEAELNKEEIDLSGYALKTELPTKTSQLENDSNYLTAVPEGYVKSLSDLGITATATELNYVDGVKSGIQSQLNNKMQSNNPIYSGIIAHQLSANLELGQDSVTFSVGGIASGPNAFAEGASTQAYGGASHSEGNSTIARGQASHAEGYRTKVKADSRGGHAEGIFTVATAPGQHVQGSANVEDEDRIYAHIVGNGDDEENRSNAYALDWQGNGWFAGDVYVGSTSGIDKDEGSKKLATEDLVAQKTQVQIITWGADD